MGVSVCPVCGEPTSRIVKFKDKEITLPLACRCAREAQAELDNQIRRDRIVFRNSEILRNGYLDRYYAELTFDKDDAPQSQESIDMKRYLSKWEQMKKKNIGLLLMGGYGTGKTFYASAIANGVRNLGDYVLIGTLNKLIHEMNDDYGSYKNEWEEKIKTYPLMVIDDLGVERDTDYSYEQIENVIDLRYRSKLPLIVTTNISKDDLKNLNDTRKERVWSRLTEMCVPYAIKGADRRRNKAINKRADFNELMGK
jgi:DNA replication protein DnaC